MELLLLCKCTYLHPEYYSMCLKLVRLKIWKPYKDGNGRPEISEKEFDAVPYPNAHYSFGAEGDSYYEYLIKAYYQSNKKDTGAKNLYDKSIAGAKIHLLR